MAAKEPQLIFTSRLLFLLDLHPHRMKPLNLKILGKECASKPERAFDKVQVVSRVHMEMAHVFEDLAARVRDNPCDPPIVEIRTVIFQILRFYRFFHDRKSALVAKPGRLMLCEHNDGFGRAAVAWIVHRGVRYAIVVVCGADVTKCSRKANANLLCQDLQQVGRTILEILHGRVKIPEPPPPVIRKFLEKKKSPRTKGDSDSSQKILEDTVEEDSDEEKSIHCPDYDTDLLFRQIYNHVNATDVATMLGLPPKDGESTGEEVFRRIEKQIEGGIMEAKWTYNLPIQNTFRSLLRLALDLLHHDKPVESFLANSRYDWPCTEISDPKEKVWLGSSIWQGQGLSVRVRIKEMHYFVEGGQCYAGPGRTVSVSSAWLVFREQANDSDLSTMSVRIHTRGMAGDTVALLFCPVYNRNSPGFKFLDKDSLLSMQMCSDLVFSRTTCGVYNPRVACEAGRIGGYIKSDRNPNCKYVGLHQGAGEQQLTISDVVASPWLATVAVQLTKDVDAYTELFYASEDIPVHTLAQSLWQVRPQKQRRILAFHSWPVHEPGMKPFN
jgi:hypothetical protein